ncbi:ABC transporter ATP-binding protein [Tissierella praeacuta]|uniref:ABC transporter ATP-binding protein n=1 Tax=Tissierella praeacuta TaxID=43131 RepID=UPI003DA47E56
MNGILNIRNLKVGIDEKRKSIEFVNDVDINIYRNQIVGLVGESGCGKSMIALSIIQLLSSPVKILEGSVELNGIELTSLKKREMKNIRGKDISIIFQEPMRALNPLHRVGDQVKEVLKIHSNINSKEAKKKVIEIFKAVGIPEPEKRYNDYPHQLSGGLNQRIMIAIAIILKPKLIIADEPTTALDVTIQTQILELMKELRDTIGSSMLLITHDLAVVCETCDYVYVMYSGQIVEKASVYDLFGNPKHPYTRALMDSVPHIDKRKYKLSVIPGTVPNFSNIPEGCRFHPRCSYAMDICKLKKPRLYHIEDGHESRCFLHYKGDGNNE